jgi:hypothetical protein
LAVDESGKVTAIFVDASGTEKATPVCDGSVCLGYSGKGKPTAHLLVRAARLFTSTYFPFFAKDPVGAGFAKRSDAAARATFPATCVSVD